MSLKEVVQTECRVHYESVEETDSARSASVVLVMPVRRRAELVAVLNWRLVCSCMILVHVRNCSSEGCMWWNIPLVSGHSVLRVVEVEVVDEVVLSAHGLREVVGDIYGSRGARHFDRCGG